MVGSAALVYANDHPEVRATVARNTDAQIRKILDDLYDGMIDKLDRPRRTGLEPRTDLRRSARPGPHAPAVTTML